MRTADVVIAGAGIAGIAAAWQIAVGSGRPRPCWSTPRPPLSLTSDRPGANYRDWWPQPPMVALADRSIALTEGLLADGASFAMDRRGYLFVTADPTIAAGLPEMAAERFMHGVDPGTVELLGQTELAARFPHLAPELRGAVHARRAGSLDTVGLGRAMLARAAAAGVTRRARRGHGGHGRRRPDRRDHRHHARRSRRDRHGAVRQRGRAVRACSGGTTRGRPRARDCPPPEGRRPGPARRRAADAPFTIGLDATGGLPAGVHVKPDTAGLAGAIKLGWARDQTPSEPVADPVCPPDFPREVLARAATIVPGLAAYLENPPELIAHDGGFYARTPDGLPVIGPHGPDGGFIVGGLAGFGSMMAAAAGDLVASWVLDEAQPDMAAAFDPRRMSEPRHVAPRAAGRAPAGEL